MGIIGDILGFGASTYDTYTNQQIANQNMALQRETNQQNREMFYDQQNFNRQERLASEKMAWDMYHGTNQFNAQQAQLEREWNSPLAQRQRLLQAGINPTADALGSVQGTSAPSGASPSPVSPAQSGSAPSMVAPRNDYSSHVFNDLLQAVAVMSQADNTRQDTFERRESFSLKLEQMSKSIENMIQDTKSKKVQRAGQLTLNNINRLLLRGEEEDYENKRKASLLQNELTSESIKRMRTAQALDEANTAYLKLKPVLEKELNSIQRQGVENSFKTALSQLKLASQRLNFDKEIQDWNEQKFDKEFNESVKQWEKNFKTECKKLGIEEKRINAMMPQLYYEMLKSKREALAPGGQKQFNLQHYDSYDPTKPYTSWE